MCEVCKLINSDRVVGGDESVVIVVPKVTAPTAMILPRQHGTMQEQPVQVQQKLFSTANMLSSFIFDNLGVHGTNVIISDSLHASYTIVGRTEEDGLDFRWKPTPGNQAEIAETAKRISEQTWYIGKEKPRPRTTEEASDSSAPPVRGRDLPPVTPESLAPRDVATKISQPVQKGPKDEHNYMIKHLTRRR